MHILSECSYFNPATDIPGLPKNTTLMKAELHVDVRPPGQPMLKPLTEGRDQFHNTIQSQQPVNLSSLTLVEYSKAQKNAAIALANREPKPGDNVVVIPLGTGSAIPSKYRNGENFGAC